MKKLTSATALAILAAGLAVSSVTYAQNQTEEAPQAEEPAAEPDDMQDMMQGGDMGGMMGMMNMMTQMSEMMDACTKMMQAAAPDEDAPEEGDDSGSPG